MNSSRFVTFLIGILLFAGTSAAGQTPDSTPPPPVNGINLIVAAQRLYELKNYDQAIEIATNASKLLPNDHRPWMIMGTSYVAQWKLKQASDAYAKATEINPKSKGLWYLKAYADRLRNAREESIAAARKAIELDLNFAEAYRILGDALGIGGKEDAAQIEALKTAFRLKPTLPGLAARLGVALSIAGDQKGAEELYRKTIELDPDKMEGRFDLGRLLVEQGRLGEARELWNGRKADVKDNTFPNFIVLLERAEKKKAAVDRLAAAPNDADALVERGFIEMDGESWVVDGRQRRAIEYFRKALAIKPSLARAQFGIAKSLVEVADLDKKTVPELEQELNKLRVMDEKLAVEVDEYRKNYSGGLKTVGPPPIKQ